MNPIELYIVIVVHLFAVPAIVYPLIYRSSPWKSGDTGKALMNMARATALLFLVAIVRFWWHFPGHEYAYAAALTYLGGAMTYQLHVMNGVRRRGRRISCDHLEARLRPYTRRTRA